MKSIFKKTLIFGIIGAVMTVNMSIMASAACPLTSLFSGNNLFSSIKGSSSNSCFSDSKSASASIADIFKNNGSSCNSASKSNSGCNTANSNSINSILDILKGKSNNSGCTTNNSNTSTNCTTGNCNTNTNTNCTTGNCNTTVNTNTNTDTSCPNGNCDTDTNCPDGNCNTSSNTGTSTTYEDYANEVLKYVNEARAANGLSALALDSTLNEAANARAVEVGTKFSHTRPDGTSCFTVLKQYNITYKACGENIASGYKTAKAVVDAWLASPGHRANIMSGSFKYMGIGKSGTNWAQLFIG